MLYYMHDSRFATVEYGEGEEISNICAHITNQSLHEDNVVGYFGEKKDLFSGFKWTLKTLSIYFRKQGIDWSQVWGRIEDVCRKTVLLAHKDMQVAATSTTRWVWMRLLSVLITSGPPTIATSYLGLTFS